MSSSRCDDIVLLLRGKGPAAGGPPVSADKCDYPLSWAMISVDNDVSGRVEAGAELSG
jgi:hypothetical protein